MTQTAKIYRIESPVGRSLWYKPDGTFDPFIMTLSNAKAKDFPMEFDPRFKEGGLIWLSAGKSIENMREWFSKQDIMELLKAGYVLYEFEAANFKIEPMQALFTRESVVRQTHISVYDIWV